MVSALAARLLREPQRMVGYVRVSTDEQAANGHGLEAQRDALEAEASRRGWVLTVVEDAGRSGSTLRGRPRLALALEMLRRHEADGLVVAKLDRLSRSVVDFAGILSRARRERWALVALDMGIDTSTPSGELVANVMMSVAQWERRVIGERTRAGLAAAKRRGVRLGRPRTLPAATLERVVTMREQGMTYRRIADTLNTEGVPAARGGRWYETTVALALRSHRLDLDAAAHRDAHAKM